MTTTDNPTARLGGDPIRTPTRLIGDDNTASTQLERYCNNRSAQRTEDASESQTTASAASLQVEVIKNEANDTADSSPLGNADQSMEENLPAGEVVTSKRKNISPDIAYKTVREHSPSDADQSRGQGSTKQISTFETSTIRKATASDSGNLHGLQRRTETHQR